MEEGRGGRVEGRRGRQKQKEKKRSRGEGEEGYLEHVFSEERGEGSHHSCHQVHHREERL